MPPAFLLPVIVGLAVLLPAGIAPHPARSLTRVSPAPATSSSGSAPPASHSGSATGASLMTGSTHVLKRMGRVRPSRPPTAGPAVPDAPTPAGARYAWPISDAALPILRRFDPPPQPWLPGHRGVDLGAPPGVAVRSAGDGVVVFAGQVAGHGVVSVEHPGGLRTTYQPLRVDIAAGSRVSTGTPLGALVPGHAGCPAVACLHWGLRRGIEYLDPLLLLALGRVRLLPPVASGGP